MKYFIIFVSFIFTFACQSQKQVQTQNVLQNTTNSKIIGGGIVAEHSNISYGIVGIYDSNYRSICTGSLISENQVLTAAHCVGESPTDMIIIFGINLNKVIDSKNQLITQYYTRRVTETKINPTYKPDENEDKEFDLGDIAIIKFDGLLPEGYHAIPLLSDSAILKRGVDIKLAGFGVDAVYTEPVNPKKIKDIDEAIAYGEVYCYDDANTDCVSVEMTGDGILRQTHAPVSFLKDTEFILDESKKHGTCNGDSGGPAYVEIDNQLFLAGVTSRGSVLCNDVGVYTNVISYADWIKATLSAVK